MNTVLNYKEHRCYKNLTKKGKENIDKYHTTNDIKQLFELINEELNKIKNKSSRYVRRSLYRSALKNIYNLDYDALIPINYGKYDTEDYNTKLNESFLTKRILFITNDIFNDLIKYDFFFLMCCCGRRIKELDKIYYKCDNNDINFFVELSKKREKEIIKLNIICDKQLFLNRIIEYQKCDHNLSTQNAKIKNIFVKNNIIKNKENNIKISSNLGRCLYVKLIYKFLNHEKVTLPSLIKKYLNHENISVSSYYNYVEFTNDFIKPSFLNEVIHNNDEHNKQMINDFNESQLKKKEQRKNKSREKMICECGSVFRRSDKSRHYRTIKHKKYVDNKQEKE